MSMALFVLAPIYARCSSTQPIGMPDMAKVRVPAPAKLARAARDMHSKSPKVRKEAAEVLALAQRHKGKRK